MPSFFKKHKDTSPPSDADPEITSAPAAPPPAADAPPLIIFPEPEGNGEDLEIAKKLDGAFTAIGGADQKVQKYEGSTSKKVLNKAGDLLDTIQTNVATAQSYSSPMKTAYESDAMKVVREGVNALVDSLPGLVKALDEVAKLHPFIGIAVSAFRVVVELDMKRRDNDKKIGVLFVEMRDMMEALLQLRAIKDEETIGPDGQTIKARMQELVKQSADDIKTCANACDTYAKKKLIVKVIKGPVWDGTLKTFIDIFAKRRKAFTFALSIHIGVGVDDANRRLKTLDEKMDIVLEFFSRAISPEQQELTVLVQKRGGPTAVMGDNEALRELIKFKSASASGAAKRTDRESAEHNSHLDGDDLTAVKQELFDSPELAIRKNLEVFERKFKMQQRELAEEMRRMVHHEGDRVIEAVTSGPHDRIIDPDIHEIWKEMRWPGHVKARHFVLALRDYFRQQVEDKKRKVHGDEKEARISDQDEWALEWININRLQAIAEAFDDDASGFITIAEVNHFTSSRPKDWSLPHWLAYWAIGWQMTATYYRDMIVTICSKMFSIRKLIHPANRNAIDKYLQTVWQKVSTLTSSFVTTYQSDTLKDRFKSYVEAEEQRLREGLKTVRYDIDAMDTLSLITGPGRIEKYLMPLLYLLIHRDFEIFRLCRTTVVHKDELLDSADTIVWVFDSIDNRHSDLEALFKQQKLDPAQQFKNFASELFDYWHDDKKFWSLDNLRTLEFTEIEYEDEKEDQNVDVGKLLNYPSAADDLYPVTEDIVTENDAQADEAVRMILGRWYGFQGAERWTIGPMTTLCFHASTTHNTYETSAIGPSGTDFTILGDYNTKDDGTVEYAFSRTYTARMSKTYFAGTLDEDGETLTGTWGYSVDNRPYTFFLKRAAPEIIIARPPPKEFEENRMKALWKYALTAVHNEVRRKMFSWSYLKQRRDVRKEYLELLQREVDNMTTDEDLERFAVLDRTSTYEDVRCFYVLQDYRQRAVPAHFMIICDICSERIYGARMVCMDCGSRFTLDFCDKPACVGAVVKTRDDITTPHLPSHDFVKIRTAILHYREIGRVLRTAKAGLERAKKILERAAEATKQSHDAAEGAAADTEGAPAPDSVKVNLPETKRARRERSDSEADSEKDVIQPTCISCSAPVAQPCWYCIDCPEEAHVFICKECDEKEGGITTGDHEATHNLVRCMDAENEEEEESGEGESTKKRLGALEVQMGALEAQMSTQTGQIDRIEKLLQSLAIARPE